MTWELFRIVDTDMVTIKYPSPYEVMRDLQIMGESRASMDRVTHLSADHLMAAASIYNGTSTMNHMIAWLGVANERVCQSFMDNQKTRMRTSGRSDQHFR